MSDELTPAMLNQKIESHEKICAERYNGIHDKISELKSLMGWAAAAVIGLLIGVSGWSLQLNYSEKDAQMRALQAQLQLVQEKMRAPDAAQSDARGS